MFCSECPGVCSLRKRLKKFVSDWLQMHSWHMKELHIRSAAGVKFQRSFRRVCLMRQEGVSVVIPVIMRSPLQAPISSYRFVSNKHPS